MSHRIKCTTYFDITATGTRNRLVRDHLPYTDRSGTDITDLASWTRSRSQQSNWETINQLLALRTLPENITDPILHTNSNAEWSFTFEIPDLSAFGNSADTFYFLKNDCTGVPMIVGLGETTIDNVVIQTHGNNTNTWFSLLS